MRNRQFLDATFACLIANECGQRLSSDTPQLVERPESCGLKLTAP
jgi:hypothetical protein